MEEMPGLAELNRFSNSRFGCDYEELDPELQAILLEMFGKNKRTQRRANSSRNWWCRLFLDTLEDWVGPDQAAQGRSLYRKGLVSKKITVSQHTIAGRVRSPQGRSYRAFVDCSEQLASALESMAIAIAGDPAIYLEFSQGQLSSALSQVKIEGGSSFAESITSEGDCSCWHWVPCKHLVALANAAADLFERDLKAGLLFFGIEYDQLSKMVMELRGADAGDGLAVPTPAHDDFGWPLIEDSQSVTSLRRFGKYSAQASDGELQTRSRRVDTAALLPKNRISGENGSMRDIFSDLYRALDSDNDGPRAW